MNRNLRALRHWVACCLAVSGVGLVWAQMPVPLLDANAPTVAPSAAAQQLEALLQCKAGAVFKTDEGVLSRNRRKFRQPINVACPAPGRWGRPNSRVTSRHFDHGNASRTSRPDCSGLDEAD